MTALTGETGAGKTLVVEALQLVLGGRANPGMVRAGATVYERIVLYVQNQHGLIAPTEGQQSGARTVADAIDSPGQILIDNRNFLIAYAREFIRAQASRGASVLSHGSLT